MKFKSTICFLATAISLHAYESISFYQLLPEKDTQPLHQKEIKIRGFLYRNPEGTHILAAEPNLKTCCFGKKIHQQITLEDLPDSIQLNQNIVEATGTFLIDPTYDNRGNLNQLYHLKNVQIKVPEKLSPIWIVLIGTFLLLGVLGWILKNRR